MNEHIKCENKNWQQTVKLQIKQQSKKYKKLLQQQKTHLLSNCQLCYFSFLYGKKIYIKLKMFKEFLFKSYKKREEIEKDLVLK